METIPEQIETDILIIGGGPAGIQASRMLRASNPELRVIVVRPEDYSMVYCAIPYAIEGLIPLEKTFKKDDLVTDSGATLLRGTVRSVDPGDHLVALEDGRTVSYGKLLIATGARPSRPPIKGADAIVGAQVIGTEAVAERIDLLTFAIQNRTTVSKLGELSYSAQPWQTFFPARNAIVEAAAIAVATGQGN